MPRFSGDRIRPRRLRIRRRGFWLGIWECWTRVPFSRRAYLLLLYTLPPTPPPRNIHRNVKPRLFVVRISQMITMSPSDSLDNIRVLRMASFGLLILGPVQHAWFNFLGRKLPRRDVATTLKKLVMGQLVLGPCITGTFFSFNASLQGESGKEIAARLNRDLLPTLMSGLLYWPFCDFLTYKVIPVHLQPLVNSSCAYLWTIYLTYMASLKKAVTD
ncbi:protein Mpv17-like isoform X2 [Ipomoea triloba]|uniref:protein Mpv17-like isoform X2 n=1 Tax=Ipomoea triloba TaxID=35885 RepID=UPI00125E8246|nr:protein Mpv17-like isoform X2 [Ipomoea triloba]